MAEKIPFVSRLPFLVVTVVLGVASVCAVFGRLSDALPINPWEPAIAMEGMRLNAGLPVYESGHATHMYGPLLTVALAGIFRVTGLNLLAARIVFSIFSFGLAVFLSAVFCRGNWRKYWWLALVLFLAINFRTNLIFLSAQPDCMAALAALLGLYFWITRRQSWLRSALSIAFFLCAVLFKQTAAAFALIPVVHALLWKRPLRFSDFAISLIPTMLILLTLAAIRFIWPQVFFAMVTIPGTIKVYYERIPGMILYLFATFPIFIIALLAAFRSRSDMSGRERWLWSSLIVLIPSSIWTICKSGGSYNSLLFAYLAMTALFLIKLGVISDWLASLSMWRGFALAGTFAVLILGSFLIQFDRAFALSLMRSGDEKYDTAVAMAHRLKGQVISPQDPTIAYRANGYFGRSLFFELDTHTVDGNWPSDLPASVQEELTRARYVVQVRSYVPAPVFERGLVASHFHPLSTPELNDSAYTIWAKPEQ